MRLERILMAAAPLLFAGSLALAEDAQYVPVAQDARYNDEKDKSMTLRDCETYIDKICIATEGKGFRVDPSYAADITNYISKHKLKSTIDASKGPNLRVPEIMLRAEGKKQDYVVVMTAYTTQTQPDGTQVEADAGRAELTPSQFTALCLAVRKQLAKK